MYDPLGFVAPVLSEGKTILQELCRNNVWFPCYEGVEEGDPVVILSFHGEADGRVLLVEVAQKIIRVVLFNNGERVIYIALPYSRWFWGVS